MLTAYFIFLAAVFTYLGFAYARRNRARHECARLGHRWTPAGMGDDPAITYICSRCYDEV